MGGIDEHRRTSFGRVAAQYHRARPSYPAAMVADTIAYAEARRGSAALEVGAGTGKATAPFAAYGLHIDAIEPSAEMVQVARSHVGHDDVRFEIEKFESAQLARDHYQLVFSGQAWHWVEPLTGERLAVAALRSGGALACFWNGVDWSRCRLRDDLAAAYAQVTAAPTGLMNPYGPELHFADSWRQRVDKVDGLSHPSAREYDWTETYSAAEYIALLGTHSDHVLMAEADRIALFGAVAGAIDEAGGALELVYRTQLCLARAD